MRNSTFLVLLALTPFAVGAQSSGPYELTKSVISGGGGTSSAGSINVSGTIGQTDASAAMSAGVYSLAGGFWTSVSPMSCADCIFADGFE